MANTREVYITTVDNPYDPKEEFEEWFSFDEAHGYHTCGLLDRMSNTSFNSFSEEENDREIERAIDEIIRIEGESLYRKIVIE